MDICGGQDASVFTGPLHALMDSHMTPSSVQIRAAGSPIELERAMANAARHTEIDIRIAALPVCARVRASPTDLPRFSRHLSDASVWDARQRLFENRMRRS